MEEENLLHSEIPKEAGVHYTYTVNGKTFYSKSRVSIGYCDCDCDCDTGNYNIAIGNAPIDIK